MFDIYTIMLMIPLLLQMNGSDGMESEESDGSGSEWEYEETYTLTGNLPAALQYGTGLQSAFHPGKLHFLQYK
jgi:hypothetical protein